VGLKLVRICGLESHSSERENRNHQPKTPIVDAYQTKKHIYVYILVGGFNLSEKYESQLGLYILPNIWKNKKMFQTTTPTSVYIYIYIKMKM
jgi:hypothetical protein